jgi:hypothetical protein
MSDTLIRNWYLNLALRFRDKGLYYFDVMLREDIDFFNPTFIGQLVITGNKPGSNRWVFQNFFNKPNTRFVINDDGVSKMVEIAEEYIKGIKELAKFADDNS